MLSDFLHHVPFPQSRSMMGLDDVDGELKPIQHTMVTNFTALLISHFYLVHVYSVYVFPCILHVQIFVFIVCSILFVLNFLFCGALPFFAHLICIY